MSHLVRKIDREKKEGNRTLKNFPKNTLCADQSMARARLLSVSSQGKVNEARKDDPVVTRSFYID